MPVENVANEPNPWLLYWETIPRRRLLFPAEAWEYVRNLGRAVPIPLKARVLDFGSGPGHVAEILAPIVSEMFVWDAAANMRAEAAANLTRVKNAFGWDPGDAETKFDLILVNSVVQYMTPDEFGRWLKRFRVVLAPGGRIVVSDLISPDHSSRSDRWDLLRFSLRKGYVIGAVRDGLAERKRHAATEAVHPRFRPKPEQLANLAMSAGLALSYLERNLTHFRSRRTAILTHAS